VLNPPKAYTPDIPTYKTFLKDGIEQFKKSTKE
jgi:hypothetical protein